MPQEILKRLAETPTPCANKYCDAVVPEGDWVYPARLREGDYCSTLCRNRHSRRIVQERRRADEKKKAADNWKRRLRKYDISYEDFHRHWDAQGGLCAVCRDPLNEKCHIDHSHGQGHVRGLLCNSCNVGIGYFKDDIVRLQSAIDYLLERSIRMVGEEVKG